MKCCQNLDEGGRDLINAIKVQSSKNKCTPFGDYAVPIVM